MKEIYLTTQKEYVQTSVLFCRDVVVWCAVLLFIIAPIHASELYHNGLHGDVGLPKGTYGKITTEFSSGGSMLTSDFELPKNHSESLIHDNHINDHTVSFWIKADTLFNGDIYQMSNSKEIRIPLSSGYIFRLQEDGNLQFFCVNVGEHNKGSSWFLTTNHPMQAGKWNHISVSVKNSNHSPLGNLEVEIFVNGESVAHGKSKTELTNMQFSNTNTNFDTMPAFVDSRKYPATLRFYAHTYAGIHLDNTTLKAAEVIRVAKHALNYNLAKPAYTNPHSGPQTLPAGNYGEIIRQTNAPAFTRNTNLEIDQTQLDTLITGHLIRTHSISFWYKAEKLEDKEIYSLSNSPTFQINGGFGYRLSLNKKGTLELYVGHCGSGYGWAKFTTKDTIKIKANQWQHLTVSIYNTEHGKGGHLNIRIWINGEKIASGDTAKINQHMTFEYDSSNGPAGTYDRLPSTLNVPPNAKHHLRFAPGQSYAGIYITNKELETPIAVQQVARTNPPEQERNPAYGLELTQSQNQLHWTVDYEGGTNNYQVQQKINNNWQTIHTVPAKGGTQVNYSQTVETGEFRIVAVDVNGHKQPFAVTINNKVTTYLELHTGWNLISVPSQHADISALGPVWAWNGTTYSETTHLNALQAAWIYLDQPRDITLTGTLVDTTKIKLKKGWNLHGPQRNCLAPDQVQTYHWNQGYQPMLPNQDILIQGTGYWFHANKELTIQLK